MLGSFSRQKQPSMGSALQKRAGRARPSDHVAVRTGPCAAPD